MKYSCVAIAALGVALLGSACSGDQAALSESGDYIVFGDFYGACIGDGCIDIFKISDGKVFEDQLNIYPIASKLPHTVEFVSVSSDRYDQIAELIGVIPGKLFDEAETVIGQPDAGDWGGFYLETNVSGEVRYWLIDKMEDNLPEYLRPYARRLDDAIAIAG